MHATTLRVPRLRVLQPDRAVVTDWGEVGEVVLRPGDELVLDNTHQGDLLLLVPRGWGSPMLGRRARGRLIAEPGGVPASPARWAVAGGVSVIERDLERAVHQGSGWQVAVLLRPTPDSTLAQIEAAQARFVGGCLDAVELDALCLDAALAPELFGMEVSVGAASTPDAAALLAERAGPGRVALSIDHLRKPQTGAGTVIEGPWLQARSRMGPEAPPAQVARVAAPGGRPQLLLFKDKRAHGA